MRVFNAVSNAELIAGRKELQGVIFLFADIGTERAGAGDGEVGGDSSGGGGGEELMTLEAEISELQRENARVESQMLRLKSDINAMETHLSHGDRVCYDMNAKPYFNKYAKICVVEIRRVLLMDREAGVAVTEMVEWVNS